jgi:hypothetical protein
VNEPSLSAKELIAWLEKTSTGWRKLLTAHPELLAMRCDITGVQTVPSSSSTSSPSNSATPNGSQIFPSPTTPISPSTLFSLSTPPTTAPSLYCSRSSHPISIGTQRSNSPPAPWAPLAPNVKLCSFILSSTAFATTPSSPLSRVSTASNRTGRWTTS